MRIGKFEGKFIRFLDNPDYGVAVCEMNTVVVGLTTWSKSDLFASDKVRFNIEGFIVSERHKSNGIGKKLILFVEEITKQHSSVIVNSTSGLRQTSDVVTNFTTALGIKIKAQWRKYIYGKNYENSF